MVTLKLAIFNKNIPIKKNTIETAPEISIKINLSKILSDNEVFILSGVYWLSISPTIRTRIGYDEPIPKELSMPKMTKIKSNPFAERKREVNGAISGVKPSSGSTFPFL